MSRESRATPGRKRLLAVIAVALLAGCAGGPSDPPAGMKVEGVTVKSNAVKQDMAVKVVVPAGGGEGKPLLVFLHGRGGDENSYLQDADRQSFWIRGESQAEILIKTGP